MPVAALVVLTALLIGNVILAWALVARRRASAGAELAAALAPAGPLDLALELAPGGSGTASSAGVRPETYDRVISIVSYVFLAGTAVVVAAGGIWPEQAPAIYLLLLTGAAAVYALLDLAPRTMESGTRRLIEGIGSVAFVTLLVVLTGGVASPFFFGYFLIVAAAALVTGGGASIVLAAGITAAYLGALLVPRGGAPFTTEQIVVIGVDVLALWLLSYLAAVVAAEQRRTRDAALRLSLHDPLTHLYNRTFLFAVIEREIARAQRTSRRFSLLMLDLDGLKPINDRYGHYFGDRMLQAVAEAVRQGIRVIDSPARYGGDEFVILLPETDTDGAAVVAEKLRRSVAAIRLNAGTELLSTTASIGVVSFPDDGVSADALTNRADQVMYVAKRAGRNRVSVDGLAVVPGTASSSPAIPSKAAAARRLAKPPAPPVRPAPPRIPLPAAASGRPPASNLALRPTRTATSRAAVEPLPSLFADRIPSLDRPWSVRAGGTPAEPVGASGGPLRVPGSSPLRTTAPPSTRMRRFRLERHLEWIEDRTFERTMRRFFGDATDETASG